jgi:hypothetical protein
MTWMIVIVGAVQLAGVAAYSAFSRAKFPKKGLRLSEQMLIVSAAIAAIASLTQVDVRAMWRPRAKVAAASSATTPRASCATVDTGMTEAEVTRRLGAPDRKLPDEETRGPGAAVLLYESSRCAVHTFDGRVELVD